MSPKQRKLSQGAVDAFNRDPKHLKQWMIRNKLDYAARQRIWDELLRIEYEMIAKENEQ